MVGKKGYIKTLEAVLAVLIIMIGSYALIPKNRDTPPAVPPLVEGAKSYLASSIIGNLSVRNSMVNGNCTAGIDINAIIASDPNKQALALYDYACLICTTLGGTSCVANTPIDRAVYMADVFISSAPSLAVPLDQQKPRVVRMWFWRKPTTPADITKYGITVYNNCSFPGCT